MTTTTTTTTTKTTTTTTIIDKKGDSSITTITATTTPRTVPVLPPSIINITKPSTPACAAANMLYEHRLVTQLPSDGWYEGSARRSSGNLLITRLDQPELYELDPADPDTPPRIVLTLDPADATGVLNLSGIPGRPDEYFVLTAFVDLVSVQISNYRVWRLRMPSPTTPEIQEPQLDPVFSLPDPCAVVSVEAVSEHLVVLGDQLNACIHLLDLRGGHGAKAVFSPLVKGNDDYFTPASEEFFGINRIRHHGGYLWFTNSSRGMLARAPAKFDSSGKGQLSVTGGIEVVTEEIENCDGLVISADGRTAYACCMTDGSLMQVEIPPAGISSGGKVTTTKVVEELINPTALLFMPGPEQQQVLHVLCSGEIEVGWRDGHSSMSWAGFADTINEGVTVSVETVVETYDVGESMSTLRI
ncbi:hypothetical protein Micbo1qcDRAFT_169411 [Microdochium bolleyi]|uniref:SMP-30/Gluconolactonase/LRE-like region domain-containing protein n=1 Tax=Microdochium bolleyi TaxID=196109 RepID=A0A136IKI9_9PEZI|nr:hypothetical protein Micbo1qcDRAFT_169411 [Microdochium bolleyi]